MDMGKYASADTHIRSLVESQQVVGAAVRLARGGRTVFSRGYGLRSVERQLPATPETLFGIGSIAKAFTALAILLLRDEGRLRLEDRIANYLPEIALTSEPLWRFINIHHVLTHTSGIPRLGVLRTAQRRSILSDRILYDDLRRGLLKQGPTRRICETYADLVGILTRRLRRMRPLPPGQRFSYSNEGYALLGAVIESASGEAYERYVTQRVLRPLGMKRTTFDPAVVYRSANSSLPYVAGYSIADTEPGREPSYWDAPVFRAAGFLYSTTGELLRFLHLYSNPRGEQARRVARPETLVSQMEARVRSGPVSFYGYGLMIQPDYHGHRLIWHSGNSQGISSFAGCLPDDGIESVALCNCRTAPAGDFARSLVNRSLGLPVTPSISPVRDKLRSHSYRKQVGPHPAPYPRTRGRVP